MVSDPQSPALVIKIQNQMILPTPPCPRTRHALAFRGRPVDHHARLFWRFGKLSPVVTMCGSRRVSVEQIPISHTQVIPYHICVRINIDLVASEDIHRDVASFVEKYAASSNRALRQQSRTM